MSNSVAYIKEVVKAQPYHDLDGIFSKTFFFFCFAQNFVLFCWEKLGSRKNFKFLVVESLKMFCSKSYLQGTAVKLLCPKVVRKLF